jgi:hypothetical protein
MQTDIEAKISKAISENTKLRIEELIEDSSL